MTLPARWLPLLCAALALPLSQMLFQGCATMVDGPTKRIKVDSEPPGAVVYVDGKAFGLTPTMLVVSRWRVPRLRFELPGYQPYDLPLERTLNPNVEGNLLLGCAPIVIDAMTGSIFQLQVPKDRRNDLDPHGTTDYGALFIKVALKPEPGARRIGQMRRKS